MLMRNNLQANNKTYKIDGCVLCVEGIFFFLGLGILTREAEGLMWDFKIKT